MGCVVKKKGRGTESCGPVDEKDIFISVSNSQVTKSLHFSSYVGSLWIKLI